MANNKNELRQLKIALINAAASGVLETSGQMLNNPMNRAERAEIVEFSGKLCNLILLLESACWETDTNESFMLKMQD